MNVGDFVDDFEAIDEHGTQRRLSEMLAEGPVVLYFYPKAFSPGCTHESCHFRDVAAELRGHGAQVIGISADEVERQAEFDSHFALGFALLSDVDHTLAQRFGVKRAWPLPNKRATFVIDTDRRLLAVIHGELHVNTHADRAIDVLRQRAAAKPQVELAR